MHYSSNRYSHQPEQNQVKVAVYAESLSAESVAQQWQEIMLTGFAIGSALSVFLLLN